MRRCYLPSLTRTCGAVPNLIASGFTALAFLCVAALFATLAGAKNALASSAQKKEKNVHALRWNPPRVDAPIPSLSATPHCALPDVLKQAGQRAEELVDHLQNFIAHEQVRYEQANSPAMLGMSISPTTNDIGTDETKVSITATFDYVVDFGERSGALQVHETRTPLPGTNSEHLSAILDKGLPGLGVDFLSPAAKRL